MAYTLDVNCYEVDAQVGNEVARRAKGLGMTVIAYDPYASEEKARAQGVQLLSLDECLAKADFHSLHMPLTPTTKVLPCNVVLIKDLWRWACVVPVSNPESETGTQMLVGLSCGAVASVHMQLTVMSPRNIYDPALLTRSLAGQSLCIALWAQCQTLCWY